MKSAKQSIIILLTILISFLCVSCSSSGKPSKVYDKAQTQLSQGNYEKAAELFDSISGYEDSSKMSMYSKALAFGESGKYDDAIKAFEILEDFKDSTYFIVYYNICKLAYSGGTPDFPYPYNMIEASRQFNDLSVFKDSAKKAEDCLNTVYNEAKQNYQDEKYGKAFSLFSLLSGFKDVDSILESDEHMVHIKEYSVGNTVFFGNYEQDNNTENGKEKIEWIVLATGEDNALLISKYGLDTQSYNSENVDITWKESTLFSWLNWPFYITAFSNDEKDQIVPRSTGEMVSLLSETEAYVYFMSNSDRKCIPTAYAIAQKCEESSFGYCYWWLQSPGFRQNYAADVGSDGSIDSTGRNVNYYRFCVRPVVLIRL